MKKLVLLLVAVHLIYVTHGLLDQVLNVRNDIPPTESLRSNVFNNQSALGQGVFPSVIFQQLPQSTFELNSSNPDTAVSSRTPTLTPAPTPGLLFSPFLSSSSLFSDFLLTSNPGNSNLSITNEQSNYQLISKKGVKPLNGNRLIEPEPEPEAELSCILAEIAQAPQLTAFNRVLQAADGWIVNALQDLSLISTVLAPTNRAFQALAIALNTTVSQVISDPQFHQILRYHLVFGAAYIQSNVQDGQVITTLLGQPLLIDLKQDFKFVGAVSQATVVVPNFQVCSSVIHVVNGVLIPDFSQLGP